MTVATPFVKRRQQVPKPRGSPDMKVTLKPLLREPVPMGSVQRPPNAAPSASSSDRPPPHRCERISPVKNRMLEIGTSGTVRGEDGNILTYSAWGKPAVRMIGGIEETSASFEARSAPRSYPIPINGHPLEVGCTPFLIRRLVAGTDRAGVAQLAPMRRESRGDCVSVADRCAGD
jgi:hypothetical protein